MHDDLLTSRSFRLLVSSLFGFASALGATICQNHSMLPAFWFFCLCIPAKEHNILPTTKVSWLRKKTLEHRFACQQATLAWNSQMSFHASYHSSPFEKLRSKQQSPLLTMLDLGMSSQWDLPKRVKSELSPFSTGNDMFGHQSTSTVAKKVEWRFTWYMCRPFARHGER